MTWLKDDFTRYSEPHLLYLSSKSDPSPRRGIFMKGGCDLASVFVAAPLIQETLKGTVAIVAQGIGIADSRPDILLQSRRELPEEAIQEVVGPSWDQPTEEESDKEVELGMSRLTVPLEYFRPVLFEKVFTLPRHEHLGEFPKDVVVLSLGPSVVRTAYRHKTHGYLIDPGGFWLNNRIDKVLHDAQRNRWFKQNFECLGRLKVEEFAQSFAEVVRLVKRDTGAHVLVFNTLIVDPGNPAHNYQFSDTSQALQRRQFDLALRDLSRELDFYILDVDNILKKSDLKKQLEFAYFPPEHMKPIAEEAYRILRELEVV